MKLPRFRARQVRVHREPVEYGFCRRIVARLHDPQLVHFGRRAVAGGIGLGLFLAFVPIPVQMLLAPPLSLWLRVNLPVAVGALWISNPLTVAPMLLFAYKVGGHVTGADTTLAALAFAPTLSGLTAVVGEIWYPLLVGCLICGLGAGFAGFVAVTGLWRFYLVQRWSARLAARTARLRRAAE